MNPTQVQVLGRRYPVISPGGNLKNTLESYGRPTIIVALEHSELTGDAELITRLHRYCSDLRVVPPLRGLPLFGATVHHFFRHELFFLTLRNNLARRAPRLLSVASISSLPRCCSSSWRR